MIAWALGWTLLVSPAPKLDLRLGDAWAERIELSFAPEDSSGDEDEERFTFERRVRVVAVKTDEMDWESSSRLVKHRFGGEELPPPSTPSLVEKMAVRFDGQRTKPVDVNLNASEFRVGRLAWFASPPENAPSEWKAEWSMVENHWAPRVWLSYRQIGKTKRLGRDCTLFETSFVEDVSSGMRASGRVEVDDASGLVTAVDLKATKTPVPGGIETLGLKFKLEVFELKLVRRQGIGVESSGSK